MPLVIMKIPTTMAKAPQSETFLDLSYLNDSKLFEKNYFWLELILAQISEQVVGNCENSIPSKMPPSIINANP